MDIYSFLPNKIVSTMKWENNDISFLENLDILKNQKHQKWFLPKTAGSQMDKQNGALSSFLLSMYHIPFLSDPTKKLICLYAKDGRYLSLLSRSEIQMPCFPTMCSPNSW